MAAKHSNDALKIVFGAMTFGKSNTLGARVHKTQDAAQIINAFQAHGHNEIDTARIYSAGSSEEMLAELDWSKRGLIMDTKLYPNAVTRLKSDESYTHQPSDVRRGLMNSLKALKTKKLDMFYLHGPDRTTPYEDTLREVNALYEEGYFNRFGLSNYMSWEVAQICELCIRNNWVRPVVYQGIYHALQRSIEGELFPCLRHYGIALYAFQPLAGGFLTGRYTRDQMEFDAGSRFDPNTMQGQLHRGRYWKDVYFEALEEVQRAGEKHGLELGEIALRWLKYHSMLSREVGDAIIIGASSINHLESNLKDLEKGPLPQEVVDQVDAIWPMVKGAAPKYWH